MRLSLLALAALVLVACGKERVYLDPCPSAEHAVDTMMERGELLRARGFARQAALRSCVGVGTRLVAIDGRLHADADPHALAKDAIEADLGGDPAAARAAYDRLYAKAEVALPGWRENPNEGPEAWDDAGERLHLPGRVFAPTERRVVPVFDGFAPAAAVFRPSHPEAAFTSASGVVVASTNDGRVRAWLGEGGATATWLGDGTLSVLTRGGAYFLPPDATSFRRAGGLTSVVSTAAVGRVLYVTDGEATDAVDLGTGVARRVDLGAPKELVAAGPWVVAIEGGRGERRWLSIFEGGAEPRRVLSREPSADEWIVDGAGGRVAWWERGALHLWGPDASERVLHVPRPAPNASLAHTGGGFRLLEFRGDVIVFRGASSAPMEFETSLRVSDGAVVSRDVETASERPNEENGNTARALGFRERRIVETGRERFAAVALAPRGGFAATASRDGSIRVWSVPEMTVTRHFTKRPCEPAGLGVGDDGSVTVVCAGSAVDPPFHPALSVLRDGREVFALDGDAYGTFALTSDARSFRYWSVEPSGGRDESVLRAVDVTGPARTEASAPAAVPLLRLPERAQGGFLGMNDTHVVAVRSGRDASTIEIFDLATQRSVSGTVPLSVRASVVSRDRVIVFGEETGKRGWIVRASPLDALAWSALPTNDVPTVSPSASTVLFSVLGGSIERYERVKGFASSMPRWLPSVHVSKLVFSDWAVAAVDQDGALLVGGWAGADARRAFALTNEARSIVLDDAGRVTSGAATPPRLAELPCRVGAYRLPAKACVGARLPLPVLAGPY